MPTSNETFKRRPQWSEPCDKYGNPINEDGSIQVYVIEHVIVDYPRKTYKNVFLCPSKIEVR